MEISNKVRLLCEELNIADGKKTNEYLFTIDAVDLFYYKGNIGAVDIKSGFTDGANDGGIDYIYSNSDAMYLVQGKSTNSLSLEDIKNVFYKMCETVQNFHDKKYSNYSKVLKASFLNSYDDLDDNKNIEMVLFTNTKIDERTRQSIEEFSKGEQFNAFSISVYDVLDIENKKALAYQESDLISEDSIKLFLNESGKNDQLSYGDNGIIVNIKASSLKKLYDKYEAVGLFSYNLREHISQKNVDDAIDETIKNDRDRFWFYNNGITIGCEDFYKDGNKIKLYDFSIINGAQTTTKIGKNKLIDEAHDFALVCKIVKSNGSLKGENDFISKISEASNSQKPIKYRDLKANAPEQKILQMNCAKNKYPLSVEIKRGVTPKNNNKVDKWQRVTNEYIGQLIYACILQKPGPARNSKNSMFFSKSIYKVIFNRKHDYDTLYDLVRLGNIYNDFTSSYIKKTNNPDFIAIAKNGKLTVLAILIYLAKKEKKIVENYTSEGVYKDNLNGLLVTDYPGDDLDKKINYLFEFVFRELQRLYEQKKESEKITSYSNFFKSEKYYEIILRSFDELDDYDKEKLSSYLTVFTLKKQYDE